MSHPTSAATTRPHPVRWLALLVVATTLPAAAQNPSYSVYRAGSATLHAVVAQRGRSVHLSVAVARGQTSCPAQPFADIVRRVQPLAAINGAVFCTRTYRPVGDVVSGGRLVYRGSRGTVLCIPRDGAPTIRRVPFGRVQDWRGYDGVLGSGPTLVRDGEVDLDPEDEQFRDPNLLGTTRHSAVGVGPNSRVYFVCVATPLSVHAFAAALVGLGCTDAMLLDGGGGTALYYRGSYIISTPRILPNLLAICPTPTAAGPAGTPDDDDEAPRS